MIFLRPVSPMARVNPDACSPAPAYAHVVSLIVSLSARPFCLFACLLPCPFINLLLSHLPPAAGPPSLPGGSAAPPPQELQAPPAAVPAANSKDVEMRGSADHGNSVPVLFCNIPSPGLPSSMRVTRFTASLCAQRTEPASAVCLLCTCANAYRQMRTAARCSARYSCASHYRPPQQDSLERYTPSLPRRHTPDARAFLLQCSAA